MDFPDALKECINGKKIRRPHWGKSVDLSELQTLNPMDSLCDILADDWEIIEDIPEDLPEVKLLLSVYTYYRCPKCGSGREVTFENVQNVSNINESTCFKCGAKVKIVNLEQFDLRRLPYEGEIKLIDGNHAVVKIKDRKSIIVHLT